MPNPYTEGQLVEQPAIQLFVKLCSRTVSAMEEVFGPPATCCCRGFCQGLTLRAGLA